MSFGLSIFRWLELARSGVRLRELFAAVLVTTVKKEVVGIPVSEAVASTTDDWMKEHCSPLIEARSRLFVLFKRQCDTFFFSMLCTVIYLCAVLFGSALRFGH